MQGQQRAIQIGGHEPRPYRGEEAGTQAQRESHRPWNGGRRCDQASVGVQ